MVIEQLKEIAIEYVSQACKELCPCIEDCFLLSCPLSTLMYSIDDSSEQGNRTMLVGTMLLADELGTKLATNEISEVNEWNL